MVRSQVCLTNGNSIKSTIKDIAINNFGFSDLRFVSAAPLIESEKHFLEWRKKNYAADMNYLLRDNPINARPEHLLSEAKTIVMFTANYHTICPPRPCLDHGRIASYAVGLDYHKVLKKKIKKFLAHPEISQIFSRSRFFTDAVPLLEKSFAIKAGLGFRGNNTLLISREYGSFNFILELITDLDIEPDHGGQSKTTSPQPVGTCGKCTRCIDLCPTQALINPWEAGVKKQGAQIDAGKCISYLTIENRGKIENNLKASIGEWLFGCDICQDICPYNRKNIPETKFEEFQPKQGAGHWLYIPEIFEMNQESFHERFCHTALTRPKHKGILRNAIIVAANSKSPEAYRYIENPEKTLKQYPDLLETFVWAQKHYQN